MPVFKYLDLSTSHLTQAEMESIATNGSCRAIPHEYGAWVSVATDKESLQEDLKELPLNGFSNLAACLRFAAAKRCAWINFDQDADREAGLKEFNW
jgi:hypothetical protein